MNLRTLPIAALGLLLAAAACELPRAHGDQNAVIVGADPELWIEVEEVFRGALAPRIQTVREERTFRITHQNPREAEEWGNLRRFRQVLVMGGPEDPWVADALDRRRDGEVAPPALFQVTDVWARGQRVSVLLLPEADRVNAVRDLAGELQRIMDEQFREYARARMFVSGRDTILADSLASHLGFSFTVPRVYRHQVLDDSIHRFRNDNPSPRELIREVTMTWRSPLPEEDPSRAELEAWRLNLSADHYSGPPQQLDTAIVNFREIDVGGIQGVEYQSAWVNPPGEWPAGGPFIVRALRCPAQDRLYLMDAWLYAPDRDKYEYMIQLETILNSFRCH